MPLTIDSKIKDLMANADARAGVDEIIPGLTSHPSLGLARNFSLRKCAKLLPDTLTPEIMERIEALLRRVGGDVADNHSTGKEAAVSRKEGFDFDEIIDRDGTNSVKYSAGPLINPLLPDEYIPMWIADMDFACPQPVIDAMKERLDKRILGYSQVLDPAYYLAVIDWMKRRHNMDVGFDNIVYSSGVVEAMKVAVERLTKNGDGVIFHTPAYHPFDDSIKKFGRTSVYSTLINNDGYYSIDWEDFEKKAKDPKNSLFFLCSPHNPTGRIWTEEELRRMADICFSNDVFVFCDEIHADLIRCGTEHISLQTLYPNEKRLMTATAPSKTFNLAGNQLANILIPDTEMANDWRMGMYCGLPNPLSIDACTAAYNECEDWLEALKVYLDGNFSYVDDTLKKNLPLAKFRIPEGTYLCWIDLRALEKSDAELKETLSRAGLFIEFADEFVADGGGFVRVNVACPRATLKKALCILCTALGGTFNEEEAKTNNDGCITNNNRLKAGDVLPDFGYSTAFGSFDSIKEAQQRKRMALLFLRYYGCTVCRLDLHRLVERYDDIRALGCDLKVVLQSDPSLLKKELEASPLPFEIICDPDQVLYKRFAIKPAKNKLALAGGIGTVKKLSAAKAAGFKHGAYEGDELQLPALFIVEPDGTICFAHYARNLADIESADEVVKLLG